MQQYVDTTGQDPPQLALEAKEASSATPSDLLNLDDEQENLVWRNVTGKLMKGARFHHAQQLARRQVLLFSPFLHIGMGISISLTMPPLTSCGLVHAARNGAIRRTST